MNRFEILTHIGHSEKVLFMRVFLSVLILIFSLQSWTKADDISDFEIEGMSIGDSALDYFSESEIQKNLYSKSKKFAWTYHNLNNSEVYEGFRFHYKTKDKKFIIHGMSGMIFYPNNIDACYTKEKEIIKELESEFPSGRKDAQGKLKHKSDTTGKSIYTYTAFYFDNGTISLECTDWTDKITSKNGWTDSLGVRIETKEFMHWIRNEAR